MKRFPRLLANILILALLNVSYINIALASTDPSAKAVPASPVSTSAPESSSAPEDDDPCLPHATKACIQQDLDDAKNEFILFRGPEGGFADEFLKTVGFDPIEDIEDAKNELDAQSDTEFNGQSNHYDKIHKKSKKRKKLMNALLNNKPLMEMLHRPSPLKFRVMVASAATVAPGSEKALFVSNDAKNTGRSFPSMKSAAARAEFSKGLAGLNVTVLPELDATCNPGSGVPGGVRDVFIGKGVSLAAEVVRELIPDDTAMVIPQNIAVVAWGLAKTAELVLDGLHAVYIECNAKKDGDAILDGVNHVKSTTDNMDTTISGISSSVSSINTTVNNTNSTVGDIKTTVGGINTHTDSVKNDLVTLINSSKGETTAAVTNSTTEITGNLTTVKNDIVNNITANKTLIVSNDNTNTTNIVNNDNTNATNIVNNDNANKTLIVNNDNANKNLIVNNANVNASNSLRLMIESDLAEPDSATPLALFMTPASKGGHLELVRAIVFETIRNLTGATIAQANAILASGDALLAAGKYKAAYAAYRKAYKTAAS